jgi:hypothetical protein
MESGRLKVYLEILGQSTKAWSPKRFLGQGRSCSSAQYARNLDSEILVQHAPISTRSADHEPGFADRDFYYGDPYFPPAEPLKGLLSKEYALQRVKLIDPRRNDPNVKPGDPYPFQGETNPFLRLLDSWPAAPSLKDPDPEAFWTGTTSIQAADEQGWVVSVTPSGGWVPAVIAGRTGVGMSQRAQSFVLSEAENPFNVIAPGKRPRSTLTPGLAMKDGRPYLSYAVQGGDTQDQNLIQFFLDSSSGDERRSLRNPNITTPDDQFVRSARPRSREDRLDESVPADVRTRSREWGAVTTKGSGDQRHLLFPSWTFWGGSSASAMITGRLVRRAPAKKKGPIVPRPILDPAAREAGGEPASGPVGPGKDDAARLDLLDAYSRAGGRRRGRGPAVVSISSAERPGDFEPWGGLGVHRRSRPTSDHSHVVAEAGQLRSSTDARRGLPVGADRATDLAVIRIGSKLLRRAWRFGRTQGRSAHHRHGNPSIPIRLERRHQRPRPDPPRQDGRLIEHCQHTAPIREFGRPSLDARGRWSGSLPSSPRPRDRLAVPSTRLKVVSNLTAGRVPVLSRYRRLSEDA